MKKDNLKVKFLIGIPGSGKSTWAKEFVCNNSSWVRVNRDDFRFMTKNQGFCEPKIESLITKLQNDAILSILGARMNVIVDNTNLKSKYIAEIAKLVENVADVEYQVFDISVKKAIERDAAREKTVGPAIITKMFKDYQILMDSFDFSTISKKELVSPKREWMNGLPYAAIFDIDGTLAHMNGKRGPFDWDKVDRDDLDIQVARMVNIHKAYGDTIIIVSGRDASCMQMTKDWMSADMGYDIPFDHMYMRRMNDFRKDNIVKKEIYENHIIGKYNITAIYDDRQQVVDFLREKLNLKVFQVEPGKF